MLHFHRHQSQRGNTWVGVLVGLAIGVIVAVGVALYINAGDSPFVDKAPARPAGSADSEPLALPGKPGDRPAASASEPKPSLDFYKILPGGETASAPLPAQPKASAPVVAERLFVQAGAYQDPSDADNLKARLALMDIEASVTRAEVPGKGVFHRVRVGPYLKFDDAEALRARLAQEGIETAIVRVKADATSAATR